MGRIKKEEVFYTLFKDFAKDITKAAEDYAKLLHDYPTTVNLIPLMKLHEVHCDEHVKKIMAELYSSFITPFDRDDISDLALRMDDIVDSMEGVAIRLELFNTSGSRTEATQLADLTVCAAKEIEKMITCLPDYKKDKQALTHSIEVGHIEDEGDTVYESALYRLFHDEDLPDARRGHVVSWLRLFDRMENTLNACDRAAGVVRNVIMKSA